jgi:hypothetical protein
VDKKKYFIFIHQTLSNQKSNTMKKIILLMLMVTVFAFDTYSQGAKRVGVQLAYGTKDLNFGYGARFEYDITKNISVVPKLTLYSGTSGYGYSVTAWALDADGHYYFTTDGLNIYALAGLAYTQSTVTSTDISFQGGLSSDTETFRKFGFNLGGGIAFPLNKKFIPFAEVRYNTAFEAVLMSAGVSFPTATTSQKSGQRKKRRF